MTEYVTIKNPRPGLTPDGLRHGADCLQGDGYTAAAEIYRAIADALENPPAIEAELRPIAFEDIKPGVRVRRIRGETALEFVVAGPIVGDTASSTDGLWLNLPECTWFVLSGPPDPDAGLIEAAARAMWELRSLSSLTWEETGEATRGRWRDDALAAIREHEAKT